MIHLFRNNRQEGPFSLEQVRAQLQGGVLSMADQAWMEDWPDWKTVAEIPGLFGAAPSPAEVRGVTTPEKKVSLRGSVCPNCGNRNSYRKTDGIGCLLMGILFVSLIGIFFIPFLPKSWHCKSCGNIWK
jgi:hypothetical protein